MTEADSFEEVLHIVLTECSFNEDGVKDYETRPKNVL
jgi:hypothetical protein